MTTARDLALITLGMPTALPVAQGDLSLALAGAEAVDLLENGALSLDGDRMVPGPRVATGDRLLDQADASLTRREPYETVDDRLWRRGSELAAAYVDDLGGDRSLQRGCADGCRHIGEWGFHTYVMGKGRRRPDRDPTRTCCLGCLGTSLPWRGLPGRPSADRPSAP